MGCDARPARGRRRKGRGEGSREWEAARDTPCGSGGLAADEKGRSRLMMRTHRAGDLRTEHIGTEVVVCGWVAHRRDHGGVVFLDVRDTAGLVQVVIDPDQPGFDDAHRVRNEWVLRVEGTVRTGPDGPVTPDPPTGEIGGGAPAVEVLNEAAPPPFPLDDRADIDEVLRLRPRSLALRRPPMQRNL